MTYRLGLTGGIGMGKSTAAQMFRDLGHPVWDADEAVHRLYGKNGKAVTAVANLFPSSLRQDCIDRTALKHALAKNPDALRSLEAVVHPLVGEDRAGFIRQHQDRSIVVLDIPLLFETGAETQMDGVAVVSTTAETQRKRVLARPGMTEETFRMILSRQIPDAEKRARADWIIPSDSLESARLAVHQICMEIVDNA